MKFIYIFMYETFNKDCFIDNEYSEKYSKPSLFLLKVLRW